MATITLNKTKSSRLSEWAGRMKSTIQLLLVANAFCAFIFCIGSVFTSPLVGAALTGWLGVSVWLCKKGGIQ